MPNVDDIVGSIDRALWRVRDRQINNITPFTYRDGLTYLEVLENIRRAVLETIEYVAKFGADQDKILKNLNDVVSNFITEVEKTHGEWNKTLDAKQKLVLDTIESFKGKLIESAIEPTNYSGIYGQDPRGLLRFRFMDKSYESVPTIGLLNMKNQQDVNAREALRSDVNNLLDTRYTKDESNDRFEPRDRRKDAVIIGSSNVVTGSSRWAERVCEDLGYTPHNYGIGGGGFTSAIGARFDTQVNNAHTGLGNKNATVGMVLIVDMLNDIRANNDVSDGAANVAGLINTYWPNAKVYVVPVIWNKSSLNLQASYMGQNISRSIQRAKQGLLPCSAAFCDGSVSWFWEGNDINANHVRGTDEVHLPDDSYVEAYHRTVAWIRGGSSWKNFGWRALDDYGVEGWGPSKESAKGLFISREGTTVNIQGSFVASHASGNDSYIWSIPSWAYPLEERMISVTDHDRNHCLFTINYKGQLQTRQVLKVGVRYFFNAFYRIW